VSKSSKSGRSRKPDRPKKPYRDFPLTPHASGAWQKKIRGRIYYFGKWARRVNGKLERIEGDGWEAALAEYQEQRDDLHAGRTPRVRGDGLTLADLCNRFLTAKLRKQEAGEIGVRSFADYKTITDLLVSAFGANRLVGDLAADDFEALRAAMVKRWGPVRLANAITRVKSVFKYGTENGLIEKTVRYGSEFKKPDKAVMRKHRAKNGARMLEAEELRALIDGAQVVGETGPEFVRPTPALRAMILLGLNAGFGNQDCATLPLSAVNLERGWIDSARPKTGIPRRCPLWPETVEALRVAIAERPEPAQYADCELVFLTTRGHAFIRSTEKSHKDRITIQFAELLGMLKLRREGVGFYTLRHVFRTVADAARDPVAIDLIMGHADPSMGAVYRERIDDSRLEAVVTVVREWLFGKPDLTTSRQLVKSRADLP
jgi:integrase